VILISHRGNVSGRNINKENRPDYIKDALRAGYHVEIDVWLVDDKFFLGHDRPEYEIGVSFLEIPEVWCHAKNLDALITMLDLGIHCFWHEKDTVTLTSKGYIWAYPGMQKIRGSIAVMPEINNDDTSECLGVCSDYISTYKNT
tara:strand:+ start:105 stop:536 length:432 start_codon:yes stop_codon:yes gene_type:complete